MTDELLQAAEKQFRKLRTRCKYIKIDSYRKQGDYYVFYSVFQCKNSVKLKKIILRADGTPVN